MRRQSRSHGSLLLNGFNNMIIALVSLCLADDPSNAPTVMTDRVEELSLLRVETPKSWAVKDGRSHPVDAHTWAILTGEVDVLGKIEAARKRGGTLGWGLIVGGGTVALGSMIPLFMIEEALSINESSDDFTKVGTRNDVRVATAFSLIGAGAMLAGTGFAARAVSHKRALDLSLHVDAAAADASIAAYNLRLQESITPVAFLTTEEVMDLEEPEPELEPIDGAAPPEGTALPDGTVAPSGETTGTGSPGSLPVEPGPEAAPVEEAPAVEEALEGELPESEAEPEADPEVAPEPAAPLEVTPDEPL